MFDHPDFEVYHMEEIPLDTDILLRDEKYMKGWEEANLKCFAGGAYEQVGFASFVAARKVTAQGIELAWFTNITDRFHEISIFLPKDRFRICVGAVKWDEKPSIFVCGNWLRWIHTRANSVFGMIDAIGFRKILKSGEDLNVKLTEIIKGVDEIALKYPQVAFISFADSIILKANWTSGYFLEGVKYTYNPELILDIFSDIRGLFMRVLNMNSYGIFSQGSNEFSAHAAIHISKSQNHISLNSLGAPFADLKYIEDAVRKRIHKGQHPASDLYLDTRFFNSLKLGYKFKEEQTSNRYSFDSKISGGLGEYACFNFDQIYTAIRRE